MKQRSRYPRIDRKPGLPSLFGAVGLLAAGAMYNAGLLDGLLTSTEETLKGPLSSELEPAENPAAQQRARVQESPGGIFTGSEATVSDTSGASPLLSVRAQDDGSDEAHDADSDDTLGAGSDEAHTAPEDTLELLSMDSGEQLGLISMGSGEHRYDVFDGELLLRPLAGLAPDSLERAIRATGGEILERGAKSGLIRVRAPGNLTLWSFQQQLMATGMVSSVRADAVAKGASCPEGEFRDLQWNLDLIEQSLACDDYSAALEDIKVAILDTGVAFEDYVDEMGSYVQVEDLEEVSFVDGIDLVNDDSHPNDDHQHGTHVAGVIASRGEASGVAPGVRIMPVKVLDAQEMGNELDVIEGIYHAVDHGADVINMSFGFGLGYFPSLELQEAIAYAAEHDVLMVASAGNEGGWGVKYPAAFPDVVAVGAARLAKSGGAFTAKRAPYSQRGFGLDLLAPGGRMSTDLNHDGDPDAILAETIQMNAPSETNYWYYTGTSQAAAHVSGTAAWLLADGAEPSEVQRLLLASADPLNRDSFHPRYGAGLVQIDAARQLAASGADVSLRQLFVNLTPRLKRNSDGETRAVVRAEVIDADGRPAPNVLVAGSWFGSASKFKSKGWTDEEGVVELKSPKVLEDDGVAFGFQVDLLLDESEMWGETAFQFYALTPALAQTIHMVSQDPQTRASLLVLEMQPEDEGLEDLFSVKKMIPSYVVKPFGPGLRSGPMVMVFDDAFMPALTQPSAETVSEISWAFDVPLESGAGELSGIEGRLVDLSALEDRPADTVLILPFDPGMGHLERDSRYPVGNFYPVDFMDQNQVFGNGFAVSAIADGFAVSAIADGFAVSAIADAFYTSDMGDGFVTSPIADSLASLEQSAGFASDTLGGQVTSTILAKATTQVDENQEASVAEGASTFDPMSLESCEDEALDLQSDEEAVSTEESANDDGDEASEEVTAP